MMKRINKLAIDLPVPEHGDIDGASIVQELLGGEFDNLTFQ